MTRWMVCLGLILVGGISSAQAGYVGLGPAQGYNVFVFGDNTQTGTDAEGAVAVGGNALFASTSLGYNSGYTVGSSLGSSATSLVVGGNYTNNYNTVHGNAIIGGNANILTPTVSGNLSVNGSLTVPNQGGSVSGQITVGGSFSVPSYFHVTSGTTPLPIDFAAAKTYLTAESAYLGSLAPTGSTTINGSNYVTMTGTNSGLNIFTLTGTQLANAAHQGITINAPSGSTVVVNIDGTAGILNSFGFTLNGVDNTHVLYNFTDATSLLISSIGVEGTILAPKANIAFNGGNINGTLIGNSVSGVGESHLHLFQGTIPTAVPEPSSVVLMACGLAFGGLFALRQRRKLRRD